MEKVSILRIHLLPLIKTKVWFHVVFIVVMIKWKATHGRKGLFWLTVLERYSPSCRKRCDSRQGSQDGKSRKTIGYIPLYSGTKVQTGNGARLWSLEVPSNSPASNKALLPKSSIPSQTAPRGRGCKCSNMSTYVGEHFTPKPQHTPWYCSCPFSRWCLHSVQDHL